MQPIIISGYPKSGSTWLTRLLADVLNSPSGGSHPSEDNKEIASEGWDRSGSYIVRKGHYRLPKLSHLKTSITTGFEVLPSPHILCPHRIRDERLIFIIRDPRDIITSAFYHWKKKSQKEIIYQVCNGGLAKLPAWNEYLFQWQQVDNVKWTSYEKLIGNPFSEVLRLLSGLDYDKARIKIAIDRQSFDNRKKQIEQDGDKLYLGKEYNLRFMRKGIVGDYKNVLTVHQHDYIWDRLGTAMKEYGYDK